MRLTFAVVGLAAMLTSTTAWAADAAAGKTLFAAKCKTCHGAEGQGNPNLAKMMKVDIKALSAPEIQSMSDADLKKAIKDGKGKMKPVALTDAEIDNVVAFVRTLKK